MNEIFRNALEKITEGLSYLHIKVTENSAYINIVPGKKKKIVKH